MGEGRIHRTPPPILVDPARGRCYPAGTKPCESWGASRLYGGSRTGGRLSNTWPTCPREGDNPGKLGLNPHRGWVVEFPHPRKCTVAVRRRAARGWGCGGLGSWRGNGPPSRRSVRAMRVGARRWPLRQGARPYGAQQARNLRNAGNRDGVSRSARALRGLSGCLKSTPQQGPGKAGGSRRGNTGGPSGGHYYWA